MRNVVSFLLVKYIRITLEHLDPGVYATIFPLLVVASPLGYGFRYLDACITQFRHCLADARIHHVNLQSATEPHKQLRSPFYGLQYFVIDVEVCIFLDVFPVFEARDRQTRPHARVAATDHRN